VRLCSGLPIALSVAAARWWLVRAGRSRVRCATSPTREGACRACRWIGRYRAGLVRSVLRHAARRGGHRVSPAGPASWAGLQRRCRRGHARSARRRGAGPRGSVGRCVLGGGDRGRSVQLPRTCCGCTPETRPNGTTASRCRNAWSAGPSSGTSAAPSRSRKVVIPLEWHLGPGYREHAVGPPAGGPTALLTGLEDDLANVTAALRTAAERRWDDLAWRLCEAMWAFLPVTASTFSEWIAVYQLGAVCARRCGNLPAASRMHHHLGFAYHNVQRYPESHRARPPRRRRRS